MFVARSQKTMLSAIAGPLATELSDAKDHKNLPVALRSLVKSLPLICRSTPLQAGGASAAVSAQAIIHKRALKARLPVTFMSKSP